MNKKTNYEIALEVLEGKWGNGAERREKLTAAGYNYNDVQSIVNALVYDTYVPEEPAKPEKKTLEVDYDSSVYDGIIVNIIV